MQVSHSDFTLDEDEFTVQERAEAVRLARDVMTASGVFPLFVKDPPEWFVTMYLLEPAFPGLQHRVAFEPTPARPGYYKAVLPLMYTHMLIVGHVEDQIGYSDRWCYQSFDTALTAFRAWDGDKDTEPTGWHRHPTTGRRQEKQPDGSWRLLEERY